MPYENIGLALQVVIALLGAFFLAFWLSLVIWTFRDVRSRSRDIFAQLLATLMVIFFNLPGLILYFMLRPQETLAQAYERALEEEALLQDIEERYACPGCKKKIQPDFQLCPSCHTRLKRPCPSCERLLQLQWSVCPYCGAVPAAPAVKAGAVLTAAKPSPVVSKPRSPRRSVTEPVDLPSGGRTVPIKEIKHSEIPAPEAYQTTGGPATDWDSESDDLPPLPADTSASPQGE